MNLRIGVALIAACGAAWACPAGGADKSAAPFRGKIVVFGGSPQDEVSSRVILRLEANFSGRLAVFQDKSEHITAIRGRVSPDGKRLAFSTMTTTDRTDAFGPIQVLDPDGRRRPIGPKGHVKAWSPDGRSLACLQKQDDGGWKSLIVEVQTGQARPIELPARGQVEDWDPVGNVLAVNVDHTDIDGGPPRHEILLVAPDGTGLRSITDPAEVNLSPRFSPRGSKLVHYRMKEVEGREFHSLVVRNADGGAPKEVLRFARLDRNLIPPARDRPDPAYWSPSSPACWSPDGKSLTVFLSNAEWRRGRMGPEFPDQNVLATFGLDGRLVRAVEEKAIGLEFSGELDWR